MIRIILTVLVVFSMVFSEVKDPFFHIQTLTFGVVLKKWLLNLGWILVASAGFGLGTGIAIKIFDFISPGINEWEEVKKGNMGVVAILVSLIIMVGIIVVVSIS